MRYDTLGGNMESKLDKGDAVGFWDDDRTCPSWR